MLHLFFHLLDSLICCKLLLCRPASNGVQHITCQHATPSPEPVHPYGYQTVVWCAAAQTAALPHFSKVNHRHRKRAVHVCSSMNVTCLEDAQLRSMCCSRDLAPKITPLIVFLLDSGKDDMILLRGCKRAMHSDLASIPECWLYRLSYTPLTDSQVREKPREVSKFWSK